MLQFSSYFKLRVCNVKSVIKYLHTSVPNETKQISIMQRVFKAALVQLKVGKNRTENLQNAENLITKAKNAGAKLIALAECFNSPYGTNFFNEYAECRSSS